MVTMLLGGLWHGASWNFVLWGGLHGAYLAVERQLRTMYPRFWESKSYPVLLLRLLLVFNITALTWVFFRSSSFSNAIKVFHNLLAVFGSTHRTAASRCLLYSELLSVPASVIKLFGLARAVKNYARIDHCRRIFYRSHLFGVSQPKHFHSVHIF